MAAETLQDLLENTLSISGEVGEKLSDIRTYVYFKGKTYPVIGVGAGTYDLDCIGQAAIVFSVDANNPVPESKED